MKSHLLLGLCFSWLLGCEAGLIGAGQDQLLIGRFPGPDGSFEAAYVVEGDYAVIGGDMLYPLHLNSISATGHQARTSLWHDGLIPYVNEANSPSFEAAVAVWNSVADQTGVRLQPRNAEVDYLAVLDQGTQCSSEVGMRGGRQVIHVGTGCELEIAIHEIGHAIGLIHEHQRPDRDAYLEIDWDNVMGGPDSVHAQTQLGILDGAIAITTELDVESIMLYPNLPDQAIPWVIDPSAPWYRVIEQPERNVFNARMSSGDIAAIEYIYALAGSADSGDGDGDAPPAPEPEQAYACADGSFAPEDARCNGDKECPDGSDEWSCSK